MSREKRVTIKMSVADENLYRLFKALGRVSNRSEYIRMMYRETFGKKVHR